MAFQNTDTELMRQPRPRFRWWRFVPVTTLLFFFGLGFCEAWYCDPPPSPSEQVVFSLVLVLMLVQTVQAGWYRNDGPAEAVDLARVFMVILLVLLVLMVLGLIIFILAVVEPQLAMFLIIGVVLFVMIVGVSLLKEGNPQS